MFSAGSARLSHSSALPFVVNVADRVDGELRIGEPIQERDPDAAVPGQVRLVDQVERDALVVAGGGINGGGELAPEVGELGGSERGGVVDDVRIADVGVVLPGPDDHIDAAGEETRDDVDEVGPVSRVTGARRRDGPALGGLDGFPREEQPDRLHAFQLIPIEELVGVNRVIGPLDGAIDPVKAGKVHGHVVQAIPLAAKKVIGRIGHRVTV